MKRAVGSKLRAKRFMVQLPCARSLFYHGSVRKWKFLTLLPSPKSSPKSNKQTNKLDKKSYIVDETVHCMWYSSKLCTK